jgi:chromodomain-helicase-DNA-binding protein 7
VSSSSECEEEEESAVVQVILGVKDPAVDRGRDESDDSTALDPLYYVKFQGKSYIHCTFLTESQLRDYEGGTSALCRFRRQFPDLNELVDSLSIPYLLTNDEASINSDWYEIDRILDDADDHGREYLVKWKSQEYCDATWEREEDIHDRAKVTEYFRRLERSNPTSIPTRWRRPRVSSYTELKEAPMSLDGEMVLRDYQLEGLNWLRFCWYHRRNSILADEMGLGKTAQMVLMLNWLAKEHGVYGPFLVVAPLSTLPQWKMEFERWTELNCVVFHGNPESRERIIVTEFQVTDERGRQRNNRVQFDVVITNYDIFRSEFTILSRIEWRYLVADEGHKLKNYQGKIYQLMQQLSFEHCTMLTGTPIQNNMTELWSLLHFVHPDTFGDLDGFLEKYGDIKAAGQVKTVQGIVQKYLLRRKKSDVEKAILPKEETIIEVALTRTQKKLYRAFLHENASTLLQQITGSSSPPLQNLMLQLRKVCNHPFLVRGAEDVIVKELREGATLSKRESRRRALVSSSGKMILVDKLLPKLRAGGHKVLIFSQMVRILDIIADYLDIVGYSYERIDGSCAEADRQAAISRFAVEDRFVFLLSTKAGGIGINLTAADTVIIFDSDWNPQNDIQAQARCHRIGQTAQVKVYRLITRGTYEHEMFDRASKKLGLDHVVLDGGDMNATSAMKPDEIEQMLRHGAYNIFADDDTDIDKFCADDIDQILERRATVCHDDVVAGGGSVFAKALFTVDETEALDLNSVDFWQSVLLTAQPPSESMALRRRPRAPQAPETDHRRVIKSLINRGYRGDKSEEVILRIALSIFSAVPVSAMIRRLLDCELPEVRDPMKEFGDDLTLAVEHRGERVLERVAYFARLDRALLFAQGPTFEWPAIFPIWEDPSLEYSLMVAVQRYGWEDIDEAIQEGSLGLRGARPLGRKAIEKRVLLLVEELEKQFGNEEIKVPIDFDPMSPNDWNMAHPDLLARSSLTEPELAALFQAIASIGLPVRKDDSVDWARLKAHANIRSVTTEAVKQVGSALANFVQGFDGADSDESVAIDGERFPEWVGLNMTGRVLRKMQNTMKNMERIHSFVATVTPKKWEIVKDAPKSGQLPEWWGDPEDRALIECLSEYGVIPFATWLVDPVFPFRRRVPENLVETVEKMAQLERKRVGKAVKCPKELDTFACIATQRSRVARALAVIEFVQRKSAAKRQKQKRRDEPASKPLNVLEVGHVVPKPKFFSRYGPLPVGYAAVRKFPGRVFKDAPQAYYRCEIRENGDAPLFVVTAIDNEHLVIEGSSINGVWRQLLEHLGLDNSVTGARALKIGYRLFGLLSPEVQEKIKQIQHDLPAESVAAAKAKASKSLRSQIVPFAIALPTFPKQLIMKHTHKGDAPDRQHKTDGPEKNQKSGSDKRNVKSDEKPKADGAGKKHKGREEKKREAEGERRFRSL